MSNAKKLKHNYICEILNNDKLNENINLLYYFNMMCPDWDNNTYFSIAKTINGKLCRWSMNRSQLVNLSIAEEEDFFCSVNTFYAMGKHKGTYAKHLNAMIVDLDYYNIPHLKGLEPWQVIELMKQDLDYPEPSFYTYSGRGLCIVWLLEKTYATKKSKQFYKMIAETLYSVFEPFGADKKVKDVARVIRPDGTKNSKNGKLVKLIAPNNQALDSYSQNPIRYELNDLAEYFWGIRNTSEPKHKPKKRPKKAVKKACKVTSLHNIYSLHCARSRDLETLVELRNNKPLEGCREQLLFLYRLQLLFTGTEPDIALQMTLNLNRNLYDPLGDAEVINATESVVENAQIYHRLKNKYNDTIACGINEYLSNGGVYLYKNSTIIKELEITSTEMEHMTTLINKETKLKNKRAKYQENKEEINQKKRESYDSKKRKENYQKELKKNNKLSRAEQNNLIRAKIKSLLAKGLTQKDISLQLDIGIATVKRHIKSIKESSL